MIAKDSPLVFASVCTERVLKEFMVCRYSLDQFYPRSDARWYLCTDKLVADYLAGDPYVECDICIDMSASHWQGTQEAKDIFFKVVIKKIDAVRKSIQKHGYAILLDTDMVFLDPFTEQMLDWIADPDIDAVLSPDFTIRKKTWNIGMVVFNSLRLVDRWEELTLSGKYPFEQIPLNVAIATGEFRYEIMPYNYNMTHWRKAVWIQTTFETWLRRRMMYQGMPVVTMHVHLFPHHRMSGPYYPLMVKNMLRRFRRCHPHVALYHTFVRDCVTFEDGQCVVTPYIGRACDHPRHVTFTNQLGNVVVRCEPAQERLFPRAIGFKRSA